MSEANPRLVPCRDPRSGPGHRNCGTCRGTGLLRFVPATGELEPCKLRQEIDPYGNPATDIGAYRSP